MTYQTIKAELGQTVFDIALQAYGDLQGLEFLYQDNPDLVFRADPLLSIGEELVVRKDVAINQINKGYFSSNKPVTE